MSEPASSDQVPVWTLGWRLKRALDYGRVSAQDMAAELGVHPGTVSRWMNDRETPRVIYLRAWAYRCRVPVDWLLHGEEGLPRVDSNHQPAGWEHERPLTDLERLAIQKDWRGLIRRGTFGQSASRESAELPIHEPR